MVTYPLRPLLVVEDSAEDFTALTRVFRKLGLPNPVVRCEDGDQALTYLQGHGQAAGWPATLPALVLLDLNLPGTDGRTVRALRRDPAAADTFPQDVVELQALFGPLRPGQAVQAVPGAGLQVPLTILGSSLYGAQLAAMLGLPYAFASHFAPDALMPALHAYRTGFEPSAQLARPHAMVAVNVVAAETDAEARRLFTSAQQSFTHLLRGTRGKLLAPVDDIEATWSPAEKAQVSRMLACSFVGGAETVRRGSITTFLLSCANIRL